MLMHGGIANRQKLFFELTNNFGMGMIILPHIINSLGGWCNAQYRKAGLHTTMTMKELTMSNPSSTV